MFAAITRNIPLIECETSFGEWRYPDRPQTPYVEERDVVDQVLEEIFLFVEKHPVYRLPRDYAERLKSNGISWSDAAMRNADVSEADEQCILALFIGIARAERFCDGTVVRFFNNGCALRWLKRLKEIDEAE